MQMSTPLWANLIAFPSEARINGTASDPWVMRTSGFCRENFPLALLLSASYVVSIFALQRWMKNREPIKMDAVQALWNFALGAFSVVGAMNVLPLVWQELQSNGVDHSVCQLGVEVRTVWVYYFCMSKVPELLDTYFIVLRKSRLRLLQWYHHMVTMVYCWHSWALLISNGALFAVMNLLVHSVMYPYFGLVSLGYRAPQPVRLFITSLQLLQMVFGVWITTRALWICPDPASYSNQVGSLLMYLSYFVLFAKLFADSYLSAAAAGAKKKKKRD